MILLRHPQSEPNAIRPAANHRGLLRRLAGRATADSGRVAFDPSEPD